MPPPEPTAQPEVSAPQPSAAKDEKPAEQVPEQPKSPNTESFFETSETRLPLSNLDDASLYWLVYEDGNIEDFNEWVAQYCPHLVSALQTWRPADSPLHEGSLERLESVHAARVGRASRPRGKRAVSESQREQHEKWCKLVNLRSASLRSFLSSPELVNVLRESKLRDEFHLAKKASRWALAMRNVPVEEWTTEMWNWAGRSIRAISKLRGSSAPLVENGVLTRKYHLLKTWGHDPSLQGRINAADVIKLQATGEAGIRRVNRLIDSLSGVPPFYVGEAHARHPLPDYSTLKQYRRAADLSEARASGPESKKSGSAKSVKAESGDTHGGPTVWKSVVDGVTYYVSNTHRAYNVALSLDEALTNLNFISKTV